MILRGVDLFLFLCVPFFVFVTGHSGESADDYSNDGCDSFRQGYFDHYKCTLQCFYDVYQLRYIYGNMCEGTVEMDSNNWGAVPFPKIIQCMECITIRCRQSIPQSVCDGSFTVSNNNYGQSWSWKGNYGDKYVNNQNQAQTNTQPDSSLSNRKYWYGEGAPSSNTGGQNYQSQMNFPPGYYRNRNFWYGNRGNAPSSNIGGGASNQEYQYQANAPPNSQPNQNGWFRKGGDSGSSEDQTLVDNSYDSSQPDTGDQSVKDYDAPIANTKSSGKTSRPKPVKPPKPTRASKIKDKYSSLLWKKSQKDKSTNAPSDSYEQFYKAYEDYGKKSQKGKSTNAPSDSYEELYYVYEYYGNGDNDSGDNSNGNGDNGIGDNRNGNGDNGNGDSTQENVSDSNYYGASTPSTTDSGYYMSTAEQSSTGLQSSYGDGNGYATSTQSTDDNVDDDNDDDDYYDYYDYYYAYEDYFSDNQTITSPVSTATEITGSQYTESPATAGSTEAITDNVPTTSQNPSISESTNNNNYSNPQTESTNDGTTSPNCITEAPKESTTTSAYDYSDAYAEYEAEENADSEKTSAQTLETSSKISQITSSSVPVYSNSYTESDDSAGTQNSKTVTDLSEAPSSTSDYPNDNGSDDNGSDGNGSNDSGSYDVVYYYYYFNEDDDTSSISSTSNGYDNTNIDNFPTKNTDWKAYTDSSNKEYDDSNKQSQDTDSNSSNGYSMANYQRNQGNNDNNQYQWNQASDGLSNSNTGPGTNKLYSPQNNPRFRPWNPSYTNNSPNPNSYQNRFFLFNNRNTGSNIGNQPDISDYNYNPSGNNYQRNFNIQNQNVQGPSKNWNVNPVLNNQQPSWQGNVVQYPNYDASSSIGQSYAVQNNQGTGNGQAPRWNLAPFPFQKPLQTGQVASSNQNFGSPGIGDSNLWNGNWQTQFSNRNPPYIQPENSQPQANGGFSAFPDPRYRNVGAGAGAGQQSPWSGNSQLPPFNQRPLQNQQWQQPNYGESAPNVEEEVDVEFQSGDKFDEIVFKPDGVISFITGDEKIEDISLNK